MSANENHPQQDDAAVNELAQQFFEALNSREPEKMLALYSPRSVMVTSSRSISGEEHIRDWYQRLFSEMLPDVDFLLTDLAGTGNFRNLRWNAKVHKSVLEPENGDQSDSPPNQFSGAAQIFRKVYYKKLVRTSPRTHTIHVVSIDLNDPGVDLVVTPPEGLGNTTSGFMAGFGLQLAINGDEWLSWTNPKGLAVSEGKLYSGQSAEPTTYISASNQVWVNGPRPEIIWDAISGSHTLVRSGEMNEKLKKCTKPDVYCHNLAPRTSLGITADNRLILTVVEGRAGHLRDAVTLRELAKLNLEFGTVKAICMDGGGSSTLAIDDYGIPKILNNPTDGNERAVSNHLGVRARYLDPIIEMKVEDGNDTIGLLDGKIIYHFTSFTVNDHE
ncbi:MAG: phosphodiester glycosidase family protein [Anaerolineales bacterium]|nr:phosphodiester glycosidase family protein [Chloroflexota bacterium]MBL6983455.1 phosphodiester glycosidase family protein [Anaerolineales bacterium]